MSDITRLLVAIAASDRGAALALLDATPSLVTAGLARRDEFFLAERMAQVYEGDTALHAAAFSYDPGMARELVTRGADVRASNRRGAEPLHAAVTGAPGSAHWNPPQQRATILVADVEVLERLADGGVEPDGRDRCALVALSRSRGQVNQRRLDSSDLVKLEAGGGHGSILADPDRPLPPRRVARDGQRPPAHRS